MKFLYITDFHGKTSFYENALKQALRLKVELIVNGGDMLPHKGGADFLTGFFPGWLERCRERGIVNIGMFGNDDLRIHLPLLDALVEKGLFHRIDGKTVRCKGWRFWGYNYVPELPFGLKDWVKHDYPLAPRPPQYSESVISAEGGYRIIEDIDEFLLKRGSIEQDLRNFDLQEPQHTVLVVHSPPYGVGLDVCLDGRKVGSRSVMNFIMHQKPRLSLHGHIHESPQVSGVWKTRVGETLAVQPGQAPVLVELSEDKILVEYAYDLKD